MTSAIKHRIAQLQQGIVPKGYKKGTIGIVPEEWRSISFSTLFTSTNRYTDDLSRYPLYSLTIEDGITKKTDRYERSHLVKKENSYKVVQPNDYAYNPMNIRFGAVARHKGNMPVAVSGYYDIFNVIHESDRAFMDCFLTCDSMITYYNKVSTGSLIEKQRVHFSDFMEFSIELPPIEERKEIAKILAAQDKVIELLNRKIEQLKLLKKYYLRKMFPQHGKNEPEVRFPGFAGAWEKHQLGKIFKKNVERNEGLIGFDKTISIASMTYNREGNGASEDSLSGYKVLRHGDVAFDGHTNKEFHYGRFVVNDLGDGIMSSRFSSLRPIDDIQIRFWKHYIHYEPIMGRLLVKATKAGTMMNELVVPEFLHQYLLLPSHAEQKKIGKFFDDLDAKIALLRRQHDEEVRKKKALMQLLLSGIVRV